MAVAPIAGTELPIISRGEVPPDEALVFHKHACPPASGGPNPDPQTPALVFGRNLLVNIDLVLNDGTKVPMWIIEDPDDSEGGRVFPSKTIRIPQNQIVNARVGCSTGTHTIHWHGIEPTPMNDGVGKLSFEVDGNFIYQFQPRAAGTYFYHCHKNTVLHFEMGLYGLLIIDPPKPLDSTIEGPPYASGGPGFASAFSPGTDHVIPYDVEAFWVADDIDSRWHTLGHNDFMQKCDADDPVNVENFSKGGFLNDLRPDIFVLTGLARKKEDPSPFTSAESSLVAPTVAAGETLLVRTLCAAYHITRFTLGIDATIIAMDGRALGVPPFQQYSRPIELPAGETFELTAARRFDLIIRPAQAGTFPVTIDFLHTVSGEKLYTAETSITAV